MAGSIADITYRPLVVIGSFSYSLYLMHSPILQILWLYVLAPRQMGPNLTCLIFMGLGTPLCLAGAWLFHLFGEKPFLQIRERKIIHVQ